MATPLTTNSPSKKDIFFSLKNLDFQEVLLQTNLRSSYHKEQIAYALCLCLTESLKRFGLFGYDVFYQRLYDIGVTNALLEPPPEYIRLRRQGIRVPNSPSYSSFFRPKLQPCDFEGAAPVIDINLPSHPSILGNGIVSFGWSKEVKVVAVEVLVSEYCANMGEQFLNSHIPVVFVKGHLRFTSSQQVREWAYGQNDTRLRQLRDYMRDSYAPPRRELDGKVGSGASISGQGMRNRGTLGFLVKLESGEVLGGSACHVTIPLSLPDDLSLPIEAPDPKAVQAVVAPAELDVLHDIHQELRKQPPRTDDAVTIYESITVIGKTVYSGIGIDSNSWRLDLGLVEFVAGVQVEAGIRHDERVDLAEVMNMSFDEVPSQVAPTFGWPKTDERWFHNGVSTGWKEGICMADQFEVWLKRTTTMGAVEGDVPPTNIDKGKVMIFKKADGEGRFGTDGDSGGGIYKIVATTRELRRRFPDMGFGEYVLVFGGLLVGVFTCPEDESYDKSMVVPGPVVQQQIKDGLSITGSIICV